MNSTSYTAARNNLAKAMETVVKEQSPLLITRQGADSVVLMSLEYYQSLEETAYLLRNPFNAKHLAESIVQLERGELQEMELID